MWCVRGDGLKGDVVTKRLLVPSVLRAWFQEVRRGLGSVELPERWSRGANVAVIVCSVVLMADYFCSCCADLLVCVLRIRASALSSIDD